MNHFYDRMSEFTLRHSHLILIFTALLTLLAGYTASHLSSRGDFIDLLPPDSQAVQDLNVIRDHVGGEGYLMIVLEGGAIEKSKQFIEALVPELQKIPQISYVDYKFDKKFFEDHNLLYIEKEDLKILAQRLHDKIDYERNKMNPFYIDLLEEKKEFNIDDIKNKYSTAEIKDYYITKNPVRLIVLAKPNGFAGSLEFCKTLLSKTKAAVQKLNPSSFDPDLKIRYTGRYVTRIEETQFMFTDLKRTTVLSLIGIFLLLALYTRQITASIFIGIPLVISILYSLALATLTIGYLNIVTSVIMGILSGMGIDFGIHLYLRYLEERHRHQSLEKAIYTLHSSTGKPLILAGLTTAVAFLVLIPIKFTGISQLGWICGGGILICTLNAYFLLPALLVFREKIIPLKYKLTLVHAPQDFLVMPKKYPKPYATLAIAGMICLVSLLELRHIKFDYNFRKLVADKNGTLALQDQISDAFGVSLSPAIVYVPKLEDIPAVTEIVTKLKKENPHSTISSALSLHSYVPTYQQEKIADIRKLGKIAENPILRFLEGEQAQKIKDLKRWAQVQPFTAKDLPMHLQQQFNPIHGHHGSFVFIFPSVDLWQGREVIRYADEIREFQKRAHDYGVRIASEAVIYSDILSLIKKDLPYTILASALAIFFFLWIDLKSFRSASLICLPLVTALLCLLGGMSIFDIRLNFMNAVVFTMLLGLGIANGVYILHRYKELGPGSLRFVLKSTGGAIFLSSTTTMIGFGSLFFAYHRGLQSIGLIAVIGMGLCLIASVTVLPAFLQVLEDRAQEHAKKHVPLKPEEFKKLAS